MLLSVEKEAFAKGYQAVIGMDEVGLGCLAGKVTVAAVCVRSSFPDLSKFFRVFDSKQVSEAKRRIIVQLVERGLTAPYAVVSASVLQINEMNILKATHWAMCKALSMVQESLIEQNVLVCVDGKHTPLSGVIPIVKGDTQSTAIGIASILAKVNRDNYMVQMERKFPGYGFAKHKGYPTVEHRIALGVQGMSPIHRVKYCRNLVVERTGPEKV